MFLHSNIPPSPPPGLSLPARGWKEGGEEPFSFPLSCNLPSDFSQWTFEMKEGEEREIYPEAEPTDSANKKTFPCFFLPNERWGKSADFRLSFLSCLSQQKPPPFDIASVCSRKRKRGTPEISPHFRTRNISKQSSPYFQMSRVFLTLSHVFPSFFPFPFSLPLFFGQMGETRVRSLASKRTHFPFPFPLLYAGEQVLVVHIMNYGLFPFFRSGNAGGCTKPFFT